MGGPATAPARIFRPRGAGIARYALDWPNLAGTRAVPGQTLADSLARLNLLRNGSHDARTHDDDPDPAGPAGRPPRQPDARAARPGRIGPRRVPALLVR